MINAIQEKKNKADRRSDGKQRACGRWKNSVEPRGSGLPITITESRPLQAYLPALAAELVLRCSSEAVGCPPLVHEMWQQSARSHGAVLYHW